MRVPSGIVTAPARDRVTTVLFDLDGTISDSAPGILGSMRAAFAEHGIEWPDDATAHTLLGPPLRVSLPPFVGDERLDAVITSYRRRYVGERAMLDATVYDGVADLLGSLVAGGTRLAVATSKPEPQATLILEHLGLAGCFAEICGDTLGGDRGTKALVVGEVLHRLGRPDPREVLMVGDRHHDVEGSRMHGVDCAGVLWGYGSRAELQAAGAWAICAVPGDVAALVG